MPPLSNFSPPLGGEMPQAEGGLHATPAPQTSVAGGEPRGSEKAPPPKNPYRQTANTSSTSRANSASVTAPSYDEYTRPAPSITNTHGSLGNSHTANAAASSLFSPPWGGDAAGRGGSTPLSPPKPQSPVGNTGD